MTRLAIASVLLAVTLATPVWAKSQLTFTASSEVRAVEGFTSRDGWALDFAQITVGLTDIVAYQTDPPFKGLSEADLIASTEVSAAGPFNGNLAEAAAVPVTMLTATAGRDNAIAFSLDAEQASMIVADDLGVTLGPEGYAAILDTVVAELGHVGEGHCCAAFI